MHFIKKKKENVKNIIYNFRQPISSLIFYNGFGPHTLSPNFEFIFFSPIQNSQNPY